MRCRSAIRTSSGTRSRSGFRASGRRLRTSCCRRCAVPSTARAVGRGRSDRLPREPATHRAARGAVGLLGLSRGHALVIVGLNPAGMRAFTVVVAVLLVASACSSPAATAPPSPGSPGACRRRGLGRPPRTGRPRSRRRRPPSSRCRCPATGRAGRRRPRRATSRQPSRLRCPRLPRRPAPRWRLRPASRESRTVGRSFAPTSPRARAKTTRGRCPRTGRRRTCSAAGPAARFAGTCGHTPSRATRGPRSRARAGPPRDSGTRRSGCRVGASWCSRVRLAPPSSTTCGCSTLSPRPGRSCPPAATCRSRATAPARHSGPGPALDQPRLHRGRRPLLRHPCLRLRHRHLDRPDARRRSTRRALPPRLLVRCRGIIRAVRRADDRRRGVGRPLAALRPGGERRPGRCSRVTGRRRATCTPIRRPAATGSCSADVARTATATSCGPSTSRPSRRASSRPPAIRRPAARRGAHRRCRSRSRAPLRRQARRRHLPGSLAARPGVGRARESSSYRSVSPGRSAWTRTSPRPRPASSERSSSGVPDRIGNVP